jgi:uncharacterized paraquat-inducible protein A
MEEILKINSKNYTMKCVACSTENIPSALFCKRCGAKLNVPKNQNNEDTEKIVNLFMLIIGASLFISLFYFVVNLTEYTEIYGSRYFRGIIGLIVPATTVISAILMPHQKAKVFLFIAFALEILFFVKYNFM